MKGGDWAAVTEDLQYLQDASERYWHYASDAHFDGAAGRHLSEHDMQLLQSIANTINSEGHVRRIQVCQNADAKNRAYDKMQMLLQLLDELGLLR